MHKSRLSSGTYPLQPICHSTKGYVFIKRKEKLSRGYLHRVQKIFSKGVGMENFFLFWSVVGWNLPYLSLSTGEGRSLTDEILFIVKSG